jgi:hypothetical protein
MGIKGFFNQPPSNVVISVTIIYEILILSFIYNTHGNDQLELDYDDGICTP